MAFLFIFGPPSATAQRFTLVGNIKTDSGRALEDCYIKIASKKTDRVLVFFNTGGKSSFSVDLTLNHPDSFLVTSTHIGYRSSAITINRYINSTDTVFININMPLLTDTLNGAVIKGPPMWVRGDTTFYRTDAFRTGDETRLNDLITKMPDFEIDEHGNLLYKKKIVEKIMIEGEEIFADKIKLMLDNFPVHVLNTVQAIENQTNDPLLKGLVNENRVFVNLGLKKEKLKAAFGEGEAGAGTGKKYYVNPVIFSMYGKFKLGYIGNWDNTGNGIGWKEQDELKNDPARLAERWCMSTEQLQLINNFENRRYITNGQMGNHFQLNIPVSHVIKSKTECNLVKDNQAQLTYNSTSLYNGTSYIERSDTNRIQNYPYLLTLKQSIDWSIDSARELDASISFYHNGNRSNKNTQYDQRGTASSAQNGIANNLNSFYVTLNYARRQTSTKAEKWFASFSRNYDPQTAYGYSSSWPVIFQLPDTAYRLLHQQLDSRLTMINVIWKKFKKTKTGLLTTGVELTSLSSSVHSTLYFNSSKNTIPFVYPEAFNNKGKLNITSLTGNVQKRILLLKIPVSFKAQGGFANMQKREDVLMSSFIPVFDLDINAMERLGKSSSHQLTLSFSQKQAQPYELYSILLPDMINSFHRYVNTALPVKELHSYYLLSHTWYKRYMHTASIIAAYTKNFSGFTSLNGLHQFATFVTDSLITIPSNHFSINVGTNINSLDNRSFNNFSIGMSEYQSFIQHDNQLLTSGNSWYYFNAGVRRKWGNSYFLNLRINSSFTANQLPEELKNEVTKNIFNVRSSLSQRVAVCKQANIVLTTEWFDNNIFTPQQISFLFMDAEFNFVLPSKHVSFIIRFQNITDQRFYRSFDIQPPNYQNFFTIPLVRRNAFVSVRYEL